MNEGFFRSEEDLTLDDYLKIVENGRSNMGEEVPVIVYRLMEYSLLQELREELGADEQARLFRRAGYRAGEYFVRHFLDASLPFGPFAAQLQRRMEEMKMGILRIESMDSSKGLLVLTVAEDADCSGLPILGENVCCFDEGFLTGVLSTYSGEKCTVREINCWAAGDRVCRFQAQGTD